MNAADLIAGARALIEPLNGRNIFEAAPVMRDTIAALLDDRDALTQRIEALEAALRDLLPLADDGAAQPGHAGSCGPWESCDSLCMDAAHDARALSAARAALQADEAAQ